MKKFLTSAFLLVIITSMTAQDKNFKPIRGTVTTDIGLTGGILNTVFSLNQSASGNLGTGGVLRFRYFYSPNIAFRIGSNFSNTTNEDKTILIPAPTNLIQTTTTKNSNFEINIGVEKHFTGAERLSTYIGGELLYGTTNLSRDENLTNGDYNQFQNSDGFGGRSKNIFGIRVFSGADYYFTKKMYLGAEFGLSVVSGTTKAAVQKVKSGSLITENTIAEEGKTSVIKPNVITALRLGYQF